MLLAAGLVTPGRTSFDPLLLDEGGSTCLPGTDAGIVLTPSQTLSAPVPDEPAVEAAGHMLPTQPDTAAFLGATSVPAAASGSPQRLDADPRSSFIDSLQLPLSTPLVTSPPHRRRAACCQWMDVVPRRSGRLAGKLPFCDPNPEKQAKRVLVNKWQHRLANAPLDVPDDGITTMFHEAFKGPVDSPTREALQELVFPDAP